MAEVCISVILQPTDRSRVVANQEIDVAVAIQIGWVVNLDQASPGGEVEAV